MAFNLNQIIANVFTSSLLTILTTVQCQTGYVIISPLCSVRATDDNPPAFVINVNWSSTVHFGSFDVCRVRLRRPSLTQSAVLKLNNWYDDACRMQLRVLELREEEVVKILMKKDTECAQVASSSDVALTQTSFTTLQTDIILELSVKSLVSWAKQVERSAFAFDLAITFETDKTFSVQSGTLPSTCATCHKVDWSNEPLARLKCINETLLCDGFVNCFESSLDEAECDMYNKSILGANSSTKALRWSSLTRFNLGYVADAHLQRTRYRLPRNRLKRSVPANSATNTAAEPRNGLAKPQNQPEMQPWIFSRQNSRLDIQSPWANWNSWSPRIWTSWTLSGDSGSGSSNAWSTWYNWQNSLTPESIDPRTKIFKIITAVFVTFGILAILLIFCELCKRRRFTRQFGTIHSMQHRQSMSDAHRSLQVSSRIQSRLASLSRNSDRFRCEPTLPVSDLSVTSGGELNRSVRGQQSYCSRYSTARSNSGRRILDCNFGESFLSGSAISPHVHVTTNRNGARQVRRPVRSLEMCELDSESLLQPAVTANATTVNDEPPTFEEAVRMCDYEELDAAANVGDSDSLPPTYEQVVTETQSQTDNRPS